MTIENQTESSEELEQDEEQESADQLDDEQLDDEQAEEVTEQAIADLSAKIEALDTQINEYRGNHINTMKRAEMKAAHYNDGQIERYVDHVGGTTADEIKASVFKLAQEIPAVDNYGDPSPMNGEKAKPRIVDRVEVGRNAIKDVLHKIRL